MEAALDPRRCLRRRAHRLHEAGPLGKRRKDSSVSEAVGRGSHRVILHLGHLSVQAMEGPLCLGIRQTPVIGIGREILRHIVMHFLLKIDTYGAVNANDLVGADACIGWDVAAVGRDGHISWVVTHGMVRTLYGRSYKFPQKCLTR